MSGLHIAYLIFRLAFSVYWTVCTLLLLVVILRDRTAVTPFKWLRALWLVAVARKNGPRTKLIFAAAEERRPLDWRAL